MPNLSEARLRRNMFSGTLGNILEWYDFAVYGSLAPILGKLFFPADDPIASLFAAFGVFALGYVARPIGGILLGHIGDSKGRKRALILSVAAMGITTTLIGVLPTAQEVGALAAFLLVSLRVLQGLSVGGEYPASIVFLAEHAPNEKRGYYASWPVFGSVVGFLLGSAFVALLTNVLGDATMESWGWRIPFLFAAVIAVTSAYFRRNMSEPAGLDLSRTDAGPPLISAVKYQWPIIIRIIALTLVNAVGFYLLWAYATSYLTEYMHISTATALDINTLSLLFMLPIITASAILSDHIGRKPLLYFVAIGSILFAVPLWWLMHHDNFLFILLGQMGFAALFGVGYAGLSAVMVEGFPTSVRCSGSALAYNVCMALFGGTTPLIAGYLLERTSNDFAPAYYLILTAAISLIAVVGLPETYRKSLGPDDDLGVGGGDGKVES